MSEYRSKKITLPGGREIEVVYLGALPDGVSADDWIELPDASAEDALEAAFTVFDQLGREMWTCEECGGDMVRPLAMEERDDGRWYVERTCPECDWHHEGSFSREDVDDYNDALEEGTEELLTALRHMARLNMEEDVERMIDAIGADRIEPMDF